MLAPASQAQERLALILSQLDELPTIPTGEFAAADVPVAVLDTNVILDLWYWKNRQAEALKSVVSSGRMTIVSSPSCLKELAVVLARPTFALTISDQEALIAQVLETAVLVRCEVDGIIGCRDAEDEKFLNLAYAVRANYLFSKDKKVLRAGRRLRSRGTRTLRPADFDGLAMMPV